MLINLQVVGKNLLVVVSLCLLLTPIGSAQFSFSYLDIPVEEDGQILAYPWTGGLNSIQYNTLDINGDGEQDLVLFDRSANKLLTFLVDADSYRYAPEYEPFFPANLVSWVLLRDYDCDGDNDLFTDSQQGLRVFRNVGTEIPEWELVVDPLPTLGSRVINLLFNDSDISSIEDLDGDGDLDILAYDFANGVNIDFHQNMSVERTGSCGLDYERVSSIYGGIFECDCGDVRFGESCPVNGRLAHIGGKAILAIDLDNDGDRELLTGEEDCDEMILLENIGNNLSADFNRFEDFFQPFGVNLTFPAAYSLDLDFDGIDDLAISTNQRTNELGLVDLSNSSFYFRNTGSEAQPNYQLMQQDFLQDQMIDLGELSHPVFFDFDNDGDQDLLVGSNRWVDGGISGVMTLYENTGTSVDPGFTMISNDYLNFSAQGFINVHPQLIDLNDDFRPDLVLTLTNPETSETGMYAMLNQSGGFDPGAMILLSDISVLVDYPTLVDINRDGMMDLLVGRRIGTLEFHRNDGTNLEPDFQLEEANFLEISTSIERIDLVPLVTDLRNDGTLDLLTTDASGELSIYSDFLNSLTLQREVLNNPLLSESSTTDFGRISWPAVTDLYATGATDLAIGTIPGGLFLLSDTTNLAAAPSEDEIALDIFPNPSFGANSVFIRSNASGTIEVFNISGKQVLSERRIPANQPFRFEAPLYPNGIYLVRYRSDSQRTISRRFIVAN